MEEDKPKVVVCGNAAGEVGKSMVQALAVKCDVEVLSSNTDQRKFMKTVGYQLMYEPAPFECSDWLFSQEALEAFQAKAEEYERRGNTVGDECRGHTNTKKVGKHNYPFWYEK